MCLLFKKAPAITGAFLYLHLITIRLFNHQKACIINQDMNDTAETHLDDQSS